MSMSKILRGVRIPSSGPWGLSERLGAALRGTRDIAGVGARGALQRLVGGHSSLAASSVIRVAPEVPRGGGLAKLHGRLMLAIDRRDLAGVDRALKAGAPVNMRDEFYTPLVRAINTGDRRIFHRILRERPDLGLRDFHGRTYASWAGQAGRVNFLRELRMRGVNLATCDGLSRQDLSKRLDPLYFAISHERLNAVEYLIGEGLPLTGVPLGGTSHLMNAAQRKTPILQAVMRALRERGLLEGEINLGDWPFKLLRNGGGGWTATHYALCRVQLENARLLAREPSVDLNRLTTNGASILDFAKRLAFSHKVNADTRKWEELVRWLESRGARSWRAAPVGGSAEASARSDPGILGGSRMARRLLSREF